MYYILFSPTKQLNCNQLEQNSNDINIPHFNTILENLKEVKDFKELKSKEDLSEQINLINIQSKKAIELFDGLSFRQIENKSDEYFQKHLIILSTLYGYSFAFDLISPHRLDYTMKIGKKFKKQNCEIINEKLSEVKTIYNLASKEFSDCIKHNQIIDFEFLTNKNGELKIVSTNAKKLRGQMLNYMQKHGVDSLEKFTFEDYSYNKELSTENKYVFSN